MRYELLLRLLEIIFKVKIYPFFINHSCLSKTQFDGLCDEMRELAFLSFGDVPQYQCFLKDYSKLNNKLIVIHRGKDGDLDAFSSSIVIPSKSVSEFLHLGLFLVSPFKRHQYLQFKLGVTSIATYLFCRPLRYQYWVTNLSSVLGTLSIMDKMYHSIYPGLKKKQPDLEHLEISREFQSRVYEYCNIAKDSVFDCDNFVYLQANKQNCFLKKSYDKRFYGCNEKHNEFYKSLANLDQGDAIFQVGYATPPRVLLAIVAYFYRIGIKNIIFKTR
jgi:hypothetical protein